MDPICRAIKHQVLLEFRYKGSDRIVAPYCHGTSTKGVEVLRAVQVGGSSSSGFGFGKLFAVGQMEGVRVTSHPFSPSDPNYNRDDSAMRDIHCRIER